MQRQPARAGERTAVMTNLLPVILGAGLIAVGVANDSRRDLLIGVALAGTGIVGLVGPRIVPPAFGISAERARAQRAAAIMLPNGIIYLVLALLLQIAIPATERGGSTLLITLFAFIMGILGILSGLGATVRARRPDGLPPAQPIGRPADDAPQGEDP